MQIELWPALDKSAPTWSLVLPGVQSENNTVLKKNARGRVSGEGKIYFLYHSGNYLTLQQSNLQAMCICVYLISQYSVAAKRLDQVQLYCRTTLHLSSRAL